jgi:hypothetical protein
LTSGQVHEKNFKVLHLCPTKAGQILASVSTTDSEFDLAERERIRQALLAYMKQHGIGTPTLAKRIKESHPREMEIPLKSLQRTLGPLRPPKEGTPEKKPTRTHDMALIICKAFVEKLPNKPTAMQALGQALTAIYKEPPGIKAGTYSVFAQDTAISELTVTALPDQTFLLLKETASTDRRTYDGVLVSDGANSFAILKDRLVHTARVHAVYQHPATYKFRGIVYDNGNLESGDIRYQDL